MVIRMDCLSLPRLLQGHRVFLQTHNFPDPDALASAYGLQVFLRQHGVEAVICYTGAVEKVSTRRMFRIFGIRASDIGDIPDMGADDYIVTVDAQKYNSNITDFPGREIACIDHHPVTEKCDEYEYADLRICGACASIITDYFMSTGTPMDKNTASALLYGLKMDTESFNRGVTDLDIAAYGYLYRLADGQKISSLYNNTMELNDLRAYGEAIKNIKIYRDVGFANISFDCPDALVAMVSDFILCLDVVEFAVVYSVRNGGFKFSVRNETEDLHAGTVTARALSGVGGGGGHFSMAGGVIGADRMPLLGTDPDQAVRERFLDVIREIRKEKENAGQNN